MSLSAFEILGGYKTPAFSESAMSGGHSIAWHESQKEKNSRMIRDGIGRTRSHVLALAPYSIFSVFGLSKKDRGGCGGSCAVIRLAIADLVQDGFVSEAEIDGSKKLIRTAKNAE